MSFDYEGHGAAIDHHHYDDHHHHHHDPGYWKKRVEWKLGCVLLLENLKKKPLDFIFKFLKLTVGKKSGKKPKNYIINQLGKKFGNQFGFQQQEKNGLKQKFLHGKKFGSQFGMKFKFLHGKRVSSSKHFFF